jgi:hypothetical protein
MIERGVFELRTARDLLKKMRVDIARLAADPLDQYAAFDFFVTASHIPDWLCPGMDQAAKDARTAMRAESVLLQVCDHVAAGSKHFEVIAKHHNSVERTELHYGAFSPAFSRAFDISELTIYLRDEAAKQLGDSIDAVDLAHRVLQYWETRLGAESSE